MGPPGHRIDVAICADHQSQIAQGARWVYDPNVDHLGELRMGRDLPPRLVSANSKGGLRSSDGPARLFTFVIRKHDGEEREIEFELPPELADGFAAMASRGRRPPGPASPAEPGQGQ